MGDVCLLLHSNPEIPIITVLISDYSSAAVVTVNKPSLLTTSRVSLNVVFDRFNVPHIENSINLNNTKQFLDFVVHDVSVD